MHLPFNDPAKGAVNFRLLACVFGLFAIPFLVSGASPSWWFTSTPPVISGTNANDYAAVNQGQVKNIAKAAVAEFDLHLPGGAGIDLHTLVGSWETPSGTGSDYSAVNLGQLKALGKPFYDRLIEVGYAATYPWPVSPNSANDYAMANIGQVKNLFSFNLTAVDPIFDTDSNALADWWETYYFGDIGQIPGAITRWDGITLQQAFEQGIDPSNYYSGDVPSITRVAGSNGQVTSPSEFLPSPLAVLVKSSIGTPLVNAPVTFSLISGSGGGLALSTTGTNALSTSLSVRTGTNGIASVEFRQPSANGIASVIEAEAGDQSSVSFSVSTVNPDSDDNGFLDAWEIQYFGHIGVNPTADEDGDGLTNLREYAGGSGLYAADYFNGNHPQIVAVSGNYQTSAPNSFLSAPLVVEVRNSSATPLANAPVSFSVASGDGRLFPSLSGSGGTRIDVRTGTNGRASLYFQVPFSHQTINIVNVGVNSPQGGYDLVEFTAYSGSPSAVPQDGLKVWLKAGAGISLLGSSVETWADQSGNNNHATRVANAANGTLPVTGTIAGKPVVTFDGSNDQLTFPSQIGSNNFTVIAVVASSGTRTSTSQGTNYARRNDGTSGQRYLLGGPQVTGSSPWPAVPNPAPASKRFSRWTNHKTDPVWKTYIPLTGNASLFPVPSSYQPVDFRYDITGNWYVTTSGTARSPYRNWSASDCQDHFMDNNSSHFSGWNVSRSIKGTYNNGTSWTEIYYDLTATSWNGLTDSTQPLNGSIQGVSAGISVGSNGISTFEHRQNYFPTTAVLNRSQNQTGLRIVSVTYTNGKPMIYDNGTPSSSGGATLASEVKGPRYLGSSEQSGNYFQGSVCELLIYNRTLTNVERKTLEDHLSERLQLNVDTDNDGLPDWWEYQIFGDLSATASADPDEDGLTNAQEYAYGTDPTNRDTDQDGLSDSVEVNTTTTNPLLWDTDGDGFPDGYEVAHGMNPLDASNGLVDANNNGIADGWEFASGYDPKIADSDGDGLKDWQEIAIGSNPYTSSDSTGTSLGDSLIWVLGLRGDSQDFDGDGLTNGEEVAAGTNPFLADTDGDGVNDKNDAFPLDPSRWQAPANNPSDHTGPTISLTAPTGAVLQ